VPAFSSTVAALLSGKKVYAALLFVMTFPDGQVTRLWTGLGNLTASDGNVYQGAGRLVSAENIDASIGTEVPNTTFKMSGVDANIAEMAQNEIANVTNALIQVYVQTFYDGEYGPEWMPVPDPLVGIGAWIGDQLSFVKQGPQLYEITLSAVSYFASRSRPQGRFYSDTDQQSIYPGDTAGRFVATLVSKTITWPLAEFIT
jgi:hypothetical protein